MAGGQVVRPRADPPAVKAVLGTKAPPGGVDGEDDARPVEDGNLGGERVEGHLQKVVRGGELPQS